MNKVSRRNLSIYSLTNAVSRFGSQFQYFAVTSLTYAITGSTLLTAVQMMANGLPYILLARFAGAALDRHDPRRVTAVALLLQAVLTLGYLLGNSVAWFFLLNFLVNSCGVFIVAAKSSLIPQMVEKEEIFAANARLASVSGGAQLIAPVVSGMILMHIQPAWAFVFNALSYLFPAIGMSYLQLLPAPNHPDEKRAVQGGAWQFVLHSPAFLGVLLLYGAYTLGMWAVNTLFYPYCSDFLGRGIDVMGGSISVYYGAFLVTGFVLEHWGKHLRSPKLLPIGFLVGAVVWSGYTFTRSIWAVMLLSAFDGIVYTYTMTRLDTWIQEDAPAAERGRVSVLVRAWDEIATIAGELGGGAIAQLVGVIGGIRFSSGVSFALVSLMLAFGRLTASRAKDVAAPDHTS